jgi:selenocysteine lyase/cysteine desulfurase
MFDVDSVRKHFPALAEGAAHFDSPGGSQVADVVADAVSRTLMSAIANRGRATRAERRAGDIVLGARLAAADLLNADPAGVVFGRSMTQLTYDFARALAATWTAGDEVVVTRLDHDANIRPWVQAAYRVGALVRWADFDPETGELSVDAVTKLLSGRTRLVAVTGASNLIGTRPRVAEISAAAHAVGAVVYVDGVHLTPHAPTDIVALGADCYVCSPYKFFGPHCAFIAADPALLETLHPEKLLPSTDVIPERFNVSSLTAVERYEHGLFQRLESELAALPQVVLHGRAAYRTPTLLFSVAGRPAAAVQSYLAGLGVNAPAGSFYAVEASRRMGLGESGAIRVGLARIPIPRKLPALSKESEDSLTNAERHSALVARTRLSG